ncbi:type VI secretion system protein TssL, long form [Rhodovarius sp.]|uniref:type VI secretion system protein TssL, long form n=1 Tax=Rhodovarius sp. TaxID=2972673 RepID=UPI0034A39526
MSDNPFGDAGNAERPATAPGGWRSEAQMPIGGPAAPNWASDAQALPKIGPSPLAAAAAPILAIIGRLANGGIAGEPQLEELRERAMRAFRAFEADARGASSTASEIRAAHYVLCAAFDDVLLNTAWGAQSNWAQKSLGSTFHQDTRSGERVFDLLAGMMRDPGSYKGALEITYLALSLGLQGKYRLMPYGMAELEQVRERLYVLLQRLRSEVEGELSPHWRGANAPHRAKRRILPLWAAFTLSAVFLCGGWLWLSIRLNGAAGELYARMEALPPRALPSIERMALITQPPVQPPPPAPRSTDAAIKLRSFLEAEIRQGLVSVDGNDQRLLVRIRNRGMFASGSATVEQRYQDILRRIGEALKDEPGQVQVLGHTDNEPINNAQFPSNQALSQVRAQRAMNILVAANGSANRFTARGVADAEPIAPNTTEAGRAENRRIEIILLRRAR